MKEFKDRIAVVTGAASGIGRAMVETFVEEKIKVVLADVDEKTLESTVQFFKNGGADVYGVHTDVSKADQVESLAQKTLSEYGAVHILCNNAGVSYAGARSWQLDLKGWEWVIGVNLMGVIHGIHYFMPIMLKQDTEAHIINTASVAGLLNDFLNIPYGVSKHGVVALSESLHLELLTQGAKIKVSVLCPGPVDTDIINSSIRNRPDDVPAPSGLTGDAAIFMDAYVNWLKTGLDPREVSQQVFDAIREERFYVITTNDFDKTIENRIENTLQRKNPLPQSPPQELMDIFAKKKGEANNVQTS